MDPTKSTDRPRWPRLVLGLVVVIVVCGVAVAALKLSGVGSVVIDFLLIQLARLQHALADHPVAVYAGAFLLYVLVAGLSLPGATAMTLAYGWMFGFWRALILVSFSSTAGATMAFLLTRYFLHDFVQRRFGEKLAGFNEAFRRDGAFYLFTLRLIPAVPFFVVNAGMGLTPIRIRTYWWVSQLGMLPGTLVYVYAGTTLPGLEELKNPSVTRILSPQLLLAFTLLGLFPLVVRKLMQRFGKMSGNSPPLK